MFSEEKIITDQSEHVKSKSYFFQMHMSHVASKFIILFRYNIKTNTWSAINPLPEPLSNMAGCVSYKEQLIFISGGYNKHEASNNVLQFDPLNENIGYEILPHLMFHRAGHIMTIVNINDEDRLLVIGEKFLLKISYSSNLAVQKILLL